MKQISMERVVDAVARLQSVKLTRGGQWLPGFLCLRAHKLAVGNPITIGGTDFYDFCRKYYWITNAPLPKKPWFDPLVEKPWKYENWPRGTFHSRYDRSLLVTKGVLTVKDEAELRTYELRDGYLAVLKEYFAGDERIPIRDFTAWMLREESFADEDSATDAVSRLRRMLGLTDVEVGALFDSSDGIEPAYFSAEKWPVTELTPYLPPPDAEAHAPPVATPEAAAEDAPEPEAEPILPMDDEVFIATLLKHLREVENFELDAAFLRSVIVALRVDRFVILCGKPGTGKTEFVQALHRALLDALRGFADVFLIHHEVHPETAEWELVGSRDLAGEYVPSPLIRDLCTKGRREDVFIVMLDEMNRALVDAYAGRLLAAISNGVPVELPGHVGLPGYPASGRWQPGPGVLLMAAINSPLTEPARLPLSGPVKRRAHLLPMPDPLALLAKAGDAVAKAKFFVICNERLVPQLRQRVLRRGINVALDRDLTTRLAQMPPEVVLERLWSVAKVLTLRPEVPFTLGIVQGILAFVLATDLADPLIALDQAIVAKIVPHLQGDVTLLDGVLEAVGEDLLLTVEALAEVRRLAEENGDRIRPLY